MNLLDVIILALIGFGVWMGYRKGAVIEIARIVGLVLAFILAVQLMDTVGIMLVSNFNLPEELISILGFAITFVVVMVLVWFGAKIIQFVLGKAHLSGINRFVGGAIGQRRAQQLAVLRLRRTPIARRAQLQRFHHVVLDVPDDQLSHDINDIIARSARKRAASDESPWKAEG